MSKNQKALVLFSGGQDSTVCLAWALKHYSVVETIGFDYGQRHHIELKCREHVLAGIRSCFPQWSGKLGQDHPLQLGSLAQISETSLTRETEIEMTASGLPNTFVPGRNLLFFTYAAALGYRRGLHVLVGGMCETDYSGYPDCREKTLQSLQSSLQLGTEVDFEIKTPLMHIDKAGTWVMADKLGGRDFLSLIIEQTHSCYKGDRSIKHEWGYGCGACPACQLRANGYRSWLGSGAFSENS